MATAKKKTRKKATRKPKDPPIEDQWQELKDASDLNNIQSYTMSGSFEPKCAINHPKFGVGVVTASYHNKIDVFFKDGSRSLVQNRN